MAQKRYRVGIMESGRRWPDSAIPKSNWDITKYLWQRELEMYGLQRPTYLDDVLVLHGSGVGAGSHVAARDARWLCFSHGVRPVMTVETDP